MQKECRKTGDSAAMAVLSTTCCYGDVLLAKECDLLLVMHVL